MQALTGFFVTLIFLWIANGYGGFIEARKNSDPKDFDQVDNPITIQITDQRTPVNSQELPVPQDTISDYTGRSKSASAASSGKASSASGLSGAGSAASSQQNFGWFRVIKSSSFREPAVEGETRLTTVQRLPNLFVYNSARSHMTWHFKGNL